MQWWFFDKAYTGNYLMHGVLHRTLTQELKVRHHTPAWSSFLVGWDHLVRIWVSVCLLARTLFYIKCFEIIVLQFVPL